MNKRYILFDLDGTLTDPGTGITKSVQYALESFSIHVENLCELLPYIGPPLRDSFQNFHGFSKDQAEKAVAKYREYFSEKGIFENELYEGIPQMLEDLKRAGKTIVLATSKPHIYAKQILAYFSLEPYFSFISGSEMDGSRSDKAQVISHAMENVGIEDASSAIMVGDKSHDIIGANQNKMPSVGVLYGYGSLRELQDAGACRIARTVDELHSILNP